MQDSVNRDQDVRRIGDLIKNAHTALLVTIGRDGELDSRPMGCVQRNFEGTVWFMTFSHSPKLKEISADNRVLVSYVGPDRYEYVSLSGRARFVEDRAQLNELWSEPLRVWFPKGPDDPEIALLAVDVEEARYWINPAGVVSYSWAYLRARLTGARPSPDEIADIGEVRLDRS